MRKKLVTLVALGIACASTLAMAQIDANAAWEEKNGKEYFVNYNGEKFTGWQMIDQGWYYFDENGVLQKDTTIDGIDLDSNGRATKESLKRLNNRTQEEKDAAVKEEVDKERSKDPLWKKDNDKWTLYDKNGNQIKDQWQGYDGEWFNFDKDGYLSTNTTIDGYKLDENGSMIDEPKETKDSSESYKSQDFHWKKVDDDWYLYDESGECIKNYWGDNNGLWYYFDESGKMLKDTTIKDYQNNDCILDSNGALINREEPGFDKHIWKDENGETHCYLNGKLCTGWASRGDKWYYFDNNGEMKKDTTIIENGKKFVLGSDGAWLE